MNIKDKQHFDAEDSQDKNLKNDSKSSVYYMCLVGILISLALLLKVIFNFILALSGYPIEVYLVVIIFSLMMIRNKYWAWFYCLLMPWVLLIIPPSILNFWDLLLEYILPLYLFFPFIYFFDFIKILNGKIKNTKLQIIVMFIVFIILSFMAYSFKLSCNIFAGVLWWTPGEWWGAFILNVTVIFGSYGICLPVSMGCLYPIYRLYNTNMI